MSAGRTWGREEVSVRGAGLGWEAGLIPEGRGLRFGSRAQFPGRL